jgi:hypothetical protein
MARNGGNNAGAQARQQQNHATAAKTEAPGPEQQGEAKPVKTLIVTAIRDEGDAIYLDCESPDGQTGGSCAVEAEDIEKHGIKAGTVIQVNPDGTISVEGGTTQPGAAPEQVAPTAPLPASPAQQAAQLVSPVLQAAQLGQARAMPLGAGLANAPAVAPAPPTDLMVTDTTATPNYPKRIHTIVVAGTEISYTFEAGKPTQMPLAHAMKFVKNEAFIVVDPATGRRYEPFADPSQRQVQIASLAPGQVIASLDELTSKALLFRCQSLNGGERYGANSDRREMIAFIVAATNPMQAGEAGDLEEMSARNLASILDD